MDLKRLNPLVDKKVLILMAGLMWCAVGVMLMRYAFTWLRILPSRQQLLFYSAGFLAAMPIHHFGFLKLADKNIKRILPVTERQSPFSFMTVKSYLIVVVMISMGIALRHSAIPKRYLSLLYNGIGLALFLSGIRYLRVFFQLLFIKRINHGVSH
jgi:hypothetical protein